MGEVYKARDTRLDRTVAIKVLPSDVAADPDRGARFEREARAIASLSHPHICALYDVGESDLPNSESPDPESRACPLPRDGVSGGETLAQRLARVGTRTRPSGAPTPPVSKSSGAPPREV